MVGRIYLLKVLRTLAIVAVFAGVVGAIPNSRAADTSDGKLYTQIPTLADSQDREGRATVGQEPPKPADPAKLNQGPAPSWIWGPDANKTYYLRTKFTGGAKAAWLRVAADNRATAWINGQQALTNDDWQSATTADVQKLIKPGENELLIEARNEGGPSGCVAKLALTEGDGSTRYVVSDGTWRAGEKRDATDWVAVTVHGKLGVQPWGDAFSGAGAAATTTRGVFQVLPGFQVERLFTVPKDQLGSWVSITFDDKGRLIASDQEGKGLCRVTLPPPGSSEPTRVERLDVKISAAQGMLHAFGSLYLSVNGGPGSGLYRVRDTNGDDQYDEVNKLASFRGGGEHGPHGLRLSPDGKSIVVVCGNHTDPPQKIDASRIPTNWNEDHLLPRRWDANGHATGRMAPGGWIAQTDPEGKTWEILSVGYRNAYDIAFNADGELFAYDSDMEWDMGMPWYRPTRATHAVSGSEFGWRSGTGKWPAYYPDSLPPLVDIGPGSPVGVTFGYGAKFPAKYQKALYLCDWTFGTMYALHLEPSGASYRAVKEEFVARTPLPLTDATVGPDGALYFTIGGRGVPSELFRVTYRGAEPTTPVDGHDAAGAELRALRREIEKYHRRADDAVQAVAFVWPHLSHADRHIRYAARVALEHQPVAAWQDRVFTESNATAVITAAIALAHQGDKALEPKLTAKLAGVPFSSLDETQRLEWLRALSLVFIRLGEPAPEVASAIAASLDPQYPSANDSLNRELCAMLVYLKSPTVVAKTMDLLKRPSPDHAQEIAELLSRNPGYGGTIARMLANQPDQQKLHYVWSLRNAKAGWDAARRVAYYQWIKETRQRSGGASFQGFLTFAENDAYENATDIERLAVETAGLRKPYVIPALPKPKGPGHDWQLDELVNLGATKLKGRSYENGRRAFAAARCVICHRFAGDGGATGPDLTQAAGRFSYKEIAEATIDPSKVVSDQYRGSVVVTNDGKVYTGRILTDDEQSLTILADPEDASKVVRIAKKDIDERKASPVSLMPKDLLDVLNEDEVLDLFAFVLSRGDQNDPMFKK